MGTKIKVCRTTRVRINVGGGNCVHTLYVSTRIAQEIRPYCARIENNTFIPLRGKNWEVVAKLIEQSQRYPDHFTQNGLAVLQ